VPLQVSNKSIQLPYAIYHISTTTTTCILLLLLILLPFYGPLSGTTWLSQYQKNIHPVTPILIINHLLSASTIYCNPWHPPCSIYTSDTLFAQSLSKFSSILLIWQWHPPLHIPYIFFTQSLSSFRITCLYHCNLFCYSTEIIPSNPSLFSQLFTWNSIF